MTVRNYALVPTEVLTQMDLILANAELKTAAIAILTEIASMTTQEATDAVNRYIYARSIT